MPGQLGTLRSARTAARWWGDYAERSVPRERVKLVVPLFEKLLTVGTELRLESMRE